MEEINNKLFYRPTALKLASCLKAVGFLTIASITVIGNGLAAFFAVLFILGLMLAPFGLLNDAWVYLSISAFFTGSIASAIFVIPQLYRRFYDRKRP